MWKQKFILPLILLLSGCGLFGLKEDQTSSDTSSSVSEPTTPTINTPPTFTTQPVADEVITGTSVLKTTFNEAVTGVTNGTSVVFKTSEGMILDMDHTAPTSGNTYTFDPFPDLVSGNYYLTVGENISIVDSDAEAASPRSIAFTVDDAHTTAMAAMSAAGISVTTINAANVAADGVTNNLLSVIPAAIGAGISTATTSAEKNLVISSLLGAVNGASSLTSTADRTITRINDTANFTILLGAISDVLVAQAVAGNLTAAELGNAVTTVNDSLDDAGADADQIASYEATFNSEITTDISAEVSLSTEYTAAVATTTGSVVLGSTYTLTSGVDIIVGTNGDDSFNATDGMLNSFDSLSAYGGNDTLQIIITLEGSISGFTMAGVENLSVHAYSDHTIDLTNTSGITKISLSGTGSVIFNNVPNSVESENTGSGHLTINYSGSSKLSPVYLPTASSFFASDI